MGVGFGEYEGLWLNTQDGMLMTLKERLDTNDGTKLG